MIKNVRPTSTQLGEMLRAANRELANFLTLAERLTSEPDPAAFERMSTRLAEWSESLDRTGITAESAESHAGSAEYARELLDYCNNLGLLQEKLILCGRVLLLRREALLQQLNAIDGANSFRQTLQSTLGAP